MITTTTTIYHGFTGWTLELATLNSLSITSTSVVYEQANGFFWELQGLGFGYDSNGHATTGTITKIVVRGPADFFLNPFREITGFSFSLARFDQYVHAGDHEGFLADLYSDGGRFVIKDQGGASLQGYGGSDILIGGEGDDVFYGSPRTDTITGGNGQDTFDYQSGTYANFKDFAAGTLQSLSGGANLDNAPDLLRLPGAPGDYRYKVILGSSWETTWTTVQRLRPDGRSDVRDERKAQVAYTFDTKEIEKAEIQDPIANKVKVSALDVYTETARTMIEAYSEKAGDSQGRGWHAVSAMELGIKPKNFGLEGLLAPYTFIDGVYEHVVPLLRNNDAVGTVLSGFLNDKKTLLISFKGSDFPTEDVVDWITDFTNKIGSTLIFYTKHYAELVKGLKAYIQDNASNIDRVLVTGHSLGGAMTQHFLADLSTDPSILSTDPSIADKLEGFTYGSIGTPGTDFNNMMNFVHTGDITNGLNWPVSGRSGSIVWINTSLATNPVSQHSAETYHDDLKRLTELANDSASTDFYNSTLAKNLREGVVWKGDAVFGNTIQVAPGRSGTSNDVIISQAADNYVLGGQGADTISFNAGGLTASHPSRVIDGGKDLDTLILPFSKSSFQAPTSDGGNLYYSFGGTPHLVGTLYSINTIIYNSYSINPIPGPAAQQVALSSTGVTQAAALETEGISIDVLDAATGTYKAASPQIAKAGQTTINVDPTKDYTDAGDGNRTVIGTAGNNVIVAGAGNKTIQAGAGNDIVLVQGSLASASSGAALTAAVITEKVLINGGTGADVMAGGTSDSTYYVDNVGDEVLEEEGGGLDLVLSSVNYTLSDHVERLTLTGAVAADGVGNDDANVITGNGAANRLSGLGGDDTLIGGLGNDTLNGGAGADRLDGGAGIDTASYSAATEGVTVDLKLIGPQVSAGEASGDVLISIENLIGGAGNDTLSGNSGNNVLEGGAGADHLDGGTGIDIASYAGSGPAVNASLMTGTGSGGDALGDTFLNIENLTGSNFDDTLEGDAGANVLAGGTNGLGGDTVSYANATTGVIVSLATTLAQNTVGAGTDTLSGFENLLGSAFNDTLTGSSLADLLAGGAGNDVISGGAGNDTLQGGADGDILIGGGGADLLDGGDDIDAASYAGSALGVTVDLTLAGPQVSAGDASGDVLISIENLIGSAFADRLTGDDNDNVLTGGAGNDILAGGGNGAAGDTASYATATAGVTVNLAVQDGVTAQNTVGAGLDTLSGLENLIGSAFNDTLRGDAVANVLTGGAGNDMLIGGFGADVLDGGAGVDTVSYAASAAAVVVVLDANGELLTDSSTEPGNDAEGDTGFGIENLIGSAFGDNLEGNDLANQFSGGDGDDILVGNGGADKLDGGVGNDVVVGGAGADVLMGGVGSKDIVWYLGSATGVRVSLGVNGAQTQGAGGDAQGDLISGFEGIVGSDYADVLTGNNFDNYLRGDAGSDTLNGGAGNDFLTGREDGDTLIGGLGNDTLWGGAGGDSFVFNSALNSTTNVDQIGDFTPGEDVLKLENAIFTALTVPGTLSVSAFVTGAAAADASDRVIYNSDTGALYYDPDGTGSAAQVTFATLGANLTGLSHTDFLVI